MSKCWTEERRRKQAENIRKHKPWAKSTGPRTESGKARSRHNAYKHGCYGAGGLATRRLLRLNREFIRESLLLARLGVFSTSVSPRNELKENPFKSMAPPPPPPQNAGTD